MAMSGVKVADDITTEFNEMKLRKTIGYLIFKISDGLIVIDQKGSSGCTFEDFLTRLKSSSEPRYAVYDYGRKLFFITYILDSMKIKDKMVYASSKDALKKMLIGISKELNIDDDSTLDIEFLDSKLDEMKK